MDIMKPARLIHLFFIILSIFVSSCSHYRLVRTDQSKIQSIAIAEPDNHTNEPRLSSYLKNNLAELFTFDGGIKVVRNTNQANCIIHTKILSLDTRGIGEKRMSSNDDDQRKYRSTIFRTSVIIEYAVSCPNDNSSLHQTHRITGYADFTELVDIDIVRKDGLNRAINDACLKIVNNTINTDGLTSAR